MRSSSPPGAHGRASRWARSRPLIAHPKRYTLSKITAAASICIIPASCLVYFSACTAPRSMRAPASGWRSFSASSIDMAAACGPRRQSTKGRHSISRWEGADHMANQPVEILLVEDNPNDVRLTLHAFKRHNLANGIRVARDGAEALEYIFCTG